MSDFFQRFRHADASIGAEPPPRPPLAIGVLLIVTIGAGALFGMVGLILAAPLTSAAVHISGELASARSKEATAAAEGAPG